MSSNEKGNARNAAKRLVMRRKRGVENAKKSEVLSDQMIDMILGMLATTNELRVRHLSQQHLLILSSIR
jgi:hypothetical protein